MMNYIPTIDTPKNNIQFETSNQTEFGDKFSKRKSTVFLVGRDKNRCYLSPVYFSLLFIRFLLP